MDDTVLSDFTGICSSTKIGEEDKVVEKTYDKQEPNLTATSFVGTGHEAKFSTPKPAQRKKSSNLDDEPDFSIVNPFENHSTLGSLHQPSFSPSVFGMSTKSCTESSSKSPGSFWSIDQIAILKPVDIDLSTLHEQQNYTKLDGASEMKAQRAIDDFFASHGNLHSPWSSSENHYLAIISPSPTCLKKKRPTAQLYANQSQQVPNSKLSDVAELHEGDSPKHSCSSRVAIEEKQKTVATQTTMSIPLDVDTEALFKKFYTYEESRASSDSHYGNVGSSSLRRKLLFPESDAPDRTREKENEGQLHRAPCTPNLVSSQEVALDDDDLSLPSKPTPRHEQDEILFFTSPISGGRACDLGTPNNNHIRFHKHRMQYSPSTSPIGCKVDRRPVDQSEQSSSSGLDDVTSLVESRFPFRDVKWKLENCESTPLSPIQLIPPNSWRKRLFRQKLPKSPMNLSMKQ